MLKLLAIGHLGKDAVINNANGKQVINFSVAHTEKYKDAQGNIQNKTVWVDCAYWTERVAIAPYLKKGTQVYIEGQPDIQTYTTQDGRSNAKLVCRVRQVQLIGGKNDEQLQQKNATSASYQPQAAPAQQPNDLDMPVDDLPF